MRIARFAFLVAALAMLALPCALMPFVHTDIGAENRLPAPKPSIVSEGTLNLSFPDQFEAWLQDHVALRGTWIGAYSKALRALGTSSEEQVILGRDGWLFFRETLNDYTGQERLSDGDISRLTWLLDTLDIALQARGSRLILALVPNKATIYPERMNPAYPRSSLSSNAQRLLEAVQTPVVPLFDILADHANEGLYFPRDTHWNGLGARYAAHAMLSTLTDVTGADIPLPRPDAPHEVVEDWPGDLSRLLDPYTDAMEPQQHYDDPQAYSYKGRYRSPEDLTIETSGGAADLNVLVLRDSFTNQLVAPLSNALASVTYRRAMPLPLTDAGDFDAVVLEMVERRLPELLDAPPAMPAPVCEPPEGYLDAPVTGLRLEIEAEGSFTRLFGALDEAPSLPAGVYLGVKVGRDETWYRAFPVSGVEGDGGRGFSALLGDLPDGAQVCVFVSGDDAVRTDWTPVAHSIQD